ncbi:MAG: alpha/beta hydrolase-fold protein, partial [Ferruginibacter sp.]
AKGADIENHVIKLSGDTAANFSVVGWKDDFPPVVRQHTASKHVIVLDTAFNIPQLNRKRRIWIYLPAGYALSKKHYPVLYMQDGQNLFDEFTAGFGEWGIDECLDTLQRKATKACIVVGIDNGTERLTEYNPFDNEKFGIGEGKKYVDFLINTLKPFIDRKYRTLKDAPNTGIAGSSMGGLFSYFAAVNYPNIFGNAGIFSPAFWIAPEIKLFTEAQGNKSGGKFFFYMGGREGQQYEDDMKSVTDKLGENSTAIIYSVVDPDGTHNEMAWRKWFPEFYSWMMAEWSNYEIRSIIK